MCVPSHQQAAWVKNTKAPFTQVTLAIFIFYHQNIADIIYQMCNITLLQNLMLDAYSVNKENFSIIYK